MGGPQVGMPAVTRQLWGCAMSVGTRNEHVDAQQAWGLLLGQHFWLASVIWSVCNARAHHLVWDLAAHTQTCDIDASPAKSHVTCLQPRIYIVPCMFEGFCFFVNTTSSRLLFVHQRSFIWTTPVDSGSNDLVLDSLRHVSGTDFYTDHLCFAALLPRCLTTFLRVLWLLHGLSTVEWATWEAVQCTGRHTYMHLGEDGMSRKGVRRLPPP